ncbi:MAG TPA: type II toxin-antitoxin system ParD family antitoxin [Tepidisphaeraceae bacterium]|jgi:antitoxin ParD1/3/4|nr:type II toxin-antitoxin system ParD family antitoxin [Tepidisphaeraceae bacterium]
MNISLRPELEQFVQEKVQGGTYASPSEVIEDALLRLREQEEGDEISGDELNRLLAEGEADLAGGNVVDAEEVFAELRRRSAEKRGRVG